MTTMSDLPGELVGEILSRVPLTSLGAVRSTCKMWNELSKDQIFGATAARKQFLGFRILDSRVYSLRLDLQGIRNNEDFTDTSIKQVSILNQIEISKIFHCDGLLLCVAKENSRLLVWNPYLGQTRWILPRNNFHRLDMYTIGYDNNRNHKILRFLDRYDYKFSELGWENIPLCCEIYDFSSNSWNVLDVNPDWKIIHHQNCVSLKGNAYITTRSQRKNGVEIAASLLSFDFTAERFGQRLPLPFHSYYDITEIVNLSCVRDEQLALLYQHPESNWIIDIWITTKIEPNAVSWSNFLKVEITTLNGFPSGFGDKRFAGSFFIDEEKKVAVVSDAAGHELIEKATIIGEEGYLKSIDIGQADIYYNLPMFFSYVPSLVQLQI